MPDLDQLLDDVVADVSARTVAPGALPAIRRSRRRRTAMAAVAAVAIVAVGGGLAAEGLGDDAASPAAGTGKVTRSDGSFQGELIAILSQAPEWTVADRDPMILGDCDGGWSSEAVGASGGTVQLSDEAGGPGVWGVVLHFDSTGAARSAVDSLVQALTSCPTATWQTRSVGDTGAVMASSALGVVWVDQHGTSVSSLEIPTSDGLPPPSVQAGIAELVHSTID